MNRLGYIDALRGIGIILLVYNHFLFFGCSGGMSTMTPLDNEVMFILMPLFFVISGFVSYRKEQATTLPQLMKILWMRYTCNNSLLYMFIDKKNFGCISFNI